MTAAPTAVSSESAVSGKGKSSFGVFATGLVVGLLVGLFVGAVGMPFAERMFGTGPVTNESVVPRKPVAPAEREAAPKPVAPAEGTTPQTEPPANPPAPSNPPQGS
jgi:hypothetical protein